MFSRFTRSFVVQRLDIPAGASAHPMRVHPVLMSLFQDLSGADADGGLYRIHTPQSAARADRYVSEAFPPYRDQLACFGYDWTGRQFALDLRSPGVADPHVVMFEPGTDRVFEIPVPFSRFHDEELVDYPEEALDRALFEAWTAETGARLDRSRCAGNRAPLYLSGTHSVGNLEIIDLEVYWTVAAVLLAHARTLPDGAEFGPLTISFNGHEIRK